MSLHLSNSPHRYSSSGTHSIPSRIKARIMGTPRIGLAGVAVLTLFAGVAPAQVIGFEDFALPGGVVNINPTMPYIEAGYQFLPLNANSAVFDSASLVMLGNPSDWFGFAEGNIITLSKLSGPP